MPRLQVFLPCQSCPPELYYIGETDRDVVKVDVATAKGLVRGKKAIVTDAQRFERSLEQARRKFPSVVSYRERDGTTICFAPLKNDGVIVGVIPAAVGVESDDEMLRQFVKCG